MLPCHASHSVPAEVILKKTREAADGLPSAGTMSLLVVSAVKAARGGGLNHLEERLLDQAQARASCTPPFLGSFA